MVFPVLVCGLRGPQTSKGQALRGPLSCRLRPAPKTGPHSPSPLAVCGSAEGDRSPCDTPNAERPPTGIFRSLSSPPPFTRLTYPPLSASGCLKKSVWESCFWISLRPQHVRCLFPNQFLHLTKRQHRLYFLFHPLLAVGKHVPVKTRNSDAFSHRDVWYSIPEYIYLLTEYQGEQKITERPSHLVVEIVKWQVSLFSTRHFPFWTTLNVLSLPHSFT